MIPNPQQTKMPSTGVSRRDFLAGTLAAGAVIGGGLGGFYFGYDRAVGSPVRVGIIGTGDEGNILIGALNPEFVEVRSIADIRPYNVWRAFNGDHSNDDITVLRPGLIKKYGWRTEDEARRRVRVYEGGYEELIRNAKADGVEAIIVALPLHLHAPAAIAAMQAGLHVLTEKLMAHSVHECKDMARTAVHTDRILAVGHQRHYNILYAQAVEAIRRGELGDVHYIRAQWHRSNLPGHDSWQMPMPEKAKPKDPLAKQLSKTLKAHRIQLAAARGAAIDTWRTRIAQVQSQMRDAEVDAKKFGYEDRDIKDAGGRLIYRRPAIEELIRWRLWDRTGAGLMAELGSHQLDAASIFIAAQHGGKKQMPLSVSAAADRPLFPTDRDIEDHVYCTIEFPAPGYDAKDSARSQKKIGVQYASINGNGFGGYGEIVYGTKAALVLSKEQEMQIVGKTLAASGVRVSNAAAGPTLDTQASGAPASVAKASGAGPEVSRGYTEEIEHWAWCIRHRAPENQPRCSPTTAMGDAVIALTANMAARRGARVQFKPEWFDVHSDETPEGVKPSVKV